MNKKIIISACAAALVVGSATLGVHASVNYPTQSVSTLSINPMSDCSLEIKLDKKEVRGSEGREITLNASTNADGYTVKFRSSNKKVASVSADGTVKLKKEGTAKITAECNGIKSVCKVEVTPQSAEKKAKDRRAKSITESNMSSIVSQVGCQVDYAYPESTIMCSAYSFAYAYYQVTGTYITPGSVWCDGCTWDGGTYYDFYSESDMLSTIKSQIDQDKSCVGLLSMSTTDTHYVTFYGYTGDGTSLSDFKIYDPWDAACTTAAGYGYSSNGYDVVVIN